VNSADLDNGRGGAKGSSESAEYLMMGELTRGLTKKMGMKKKKLSA
jgi:hypothetical protein